MRKVPAKRSLISKAVVLARGLGTRMRSQDTAATLSLEQIKIADTGIKAMIPIGRPFLDYAISALADAEITQVCLVIGPGPEHDVIREHYRSVAPRRITIDFAIQEEPIGTANAVLAAEEFANGDYFLTLNSDNYYPVAVLRALREGGGAAIAAFERETLVRESNFGADRVRQYAVLKIEDGYLTKIVEKPAQMEDGEVFISMNCWAFGPKIFDACRSIGMSSRGEFEIADAVQYAIDRLGERFRALPMHSWVLDLSNRADIASITKRLAKTKVAL